MTNVKSAMVAVREGKTIKIDVDERRCIYIDAEQSDEDPEVIVHFNMHLHYKPEGEMGYYRHIDGLELMKTLQHHEFKIVSGAAVELDDE